jgi:hypothetical protein
MICASVKSAVKNNTIKDAAYYGIIILGLILSCAAELVASHYLNAPVIVEMSSREQNPFLASSQQSLQDSPKQGGVLLPSADFIPTRLGQTEIERLLESPFCPEPARYNEKRDACAGTGFNVSKGSCICYDISSCCYDVLPCNCCCYCYNCFPLVIPPERFKNSFDTMSYNQAPGCCNKLNLFIRKQYSLFDKKCLNYCLLMDHHQRQNDIASYQGSYYRVRKDMNCLCFAYQNGNYACNRCCSCQDTDENRKRIFIGACAAIILVSGAALALKYTVGEIDHRSSEVPEQDGSASGMVTTLKKLKATRVKKRQ